LLASPLSKLVPPFSFSFAQPIRRPHQRSTRHCPGLRHHGPQSTQRLLPLHHQVHLDAGRL
jgi:hypothetical protein